MTKTIAISGVDKKLVADAKEANRLSRITNKAIVEIALEDLRDKGNNA